MLEVIARENDCFQAELYKNSQTVIERKKDVLYYDCTNYYFEIEEEDDFRKYGCSKEHRPNPIVQMGLFMDADGIPLSFSVFDGNQLFLLIRNRLKMKLNMMDFMPYVQSWIMMFRISSKSNPKKRKIATYFFHYKCFQSAYSTIGGIKFSIALHSLG